MASDPIRHLPASRIPLFRDNGPRPDPAGEADYIKSAAALHAQLRERDRAEADAAAPPHQQKSSAATPQANRPVMSHEQREAERALFRHAGNWLELHHLCRNKRCRRAGECRGEPVACFRAAMPKVPEAARQFVRAMIEGQELGLSFEEAMEDAEELQVGWAAWIAGLEAAAAARVRAGERGERPVRTPGQPASKGPKNGA